jgi:predicted  nucleic acid-binding Zn-ribbon protein
MNPTLFPRTAAAFLLCALSTSCGDDPELVRKREAQKAEIRKLEGELSILKERLEQAPPDRGAELLRLKEEAVASEGRIVALESEVEGLEKKKRALEREFESYRRKYVVR